MQKLYKIILVTFTILFISRQAFSQDNLTLYNMKSVAEKCYLNPGKMPETRLNINLPLLSSTSFGYTNSGFVLSDLITKRPQDDSLLLTSDNMLSKLSDKNLLGAAFSTDLLGVGVRVKQNYYSLNVSIKGDVNLSYPKDMMKLLLKGNAAFLGQDANFNFKMNSTTYTQSALGFTHITNDKKLSYGAKFKILSGIANINTVRGNVSVYTDSSDYSVKVTPNILINSSLIDTGSIASNGASNNIFGNNKGIGFDIGAEYKLNDKITLSASIIDIGSIGWKSNVSNYQSNPKYPTFQFSGYDVKKLFNGSTTQPYLDTLSDSLKNTFYPIKTNNSYRTKLGTKVYAGINCQITYKLDAALLFYGRSVNDEFKTGFTLSINEEMLKWLSASLSYSHIYTSSNLGFGLSLNLLPIQIYFVSDNIFALSKIDQTHNTNARFGMNIAIGRSKD